MLGGGGVSGAEGTKGPQSPLASGVAAHINILTHHVLSVSTVCSLYQAGSLVSFK